VRRELGGLDRVTAWLRDIAMVNVAPGFNLTPRITNGYSDLILELYGAEVGAHARSSTGMMIPPTAPVNCEAEVEIDGDRARCQPVERFLGQGRRVVRHHFPVYPSGGKELVAIKVFFTPPVEVTKPGAGCQPNIGRAPTAAYLQHQPETFILRPDLTAYTGMQFAILGPLDVRVAGLAVPLGGAKPRLLLAVLLLHSNKVVPAESLIDLLWGDNPPRTANNVLQAHVAGLRRRLRDAAPREAGRLVTRGSGYLLDVQPDELDATVFEQLDSDARGIATVDPADACELLQRALRLWRGRPLEDVDVPAELRSAVTRLEELRLGTIERKLELDIQQGRGDEAAADLALLVDEHPLRERLLGLRMLALYQQGRQADALAAYRAGRRLIVAELGVEPGPELQRIERAILKQDSTDLPDRVAALSDAARAVGGAAVPVAADNLPAELTRFVGRQAQVGDLAKLVRGTARLLTVTGIGGAGKTRVVREVGRATRGLWPDGIWLVDLTAVSTGDRLVDAVATAVGVKEQAGRPLFEAVAGFLRNRELLLILDNCEPLIDDCARLCEALLQAAAGLTILASSREPMRVGGETTWALQPLELPGDTETDRAAGGVRSCATLARASTRGGSTPPLRRRRAARSRQHRGAG
jgi:DNA-binding SARP family transcriptional activator